MNARYLLTISNASCLNLLIFSYGFALISLILALRHLAIAALGEDWVKTWKVGLPSHEQTPGNINIPMVLWLRNLAIAYDMKEYGQARYNLMGNGGHWFPGQKADKLQDFDLHNAIRLSPHRAKILRFLEEAHNILGGTEVKRLSES